jgi:photosystem II stability/assembly factor-like uncharacterized protein
MGGTRRSAVATALGFIAAGVIGLSFIGLSFIGPGATPAYAAQAAVATVVAGTAHQALFAVAFAGDRGTAVGAAGQILLTEDGGKHWRPSTQSGVTSLSLLGVDVESAGQIAVGQAGTIYVNDTADHWTQVEAPTKERLFAVNMNAHGTAAAVGAFGTIILSDDRGHTWRSIAPADIAQYSGEGADPHLYAVALDDRGMLTVAGEFGLILRSSDEGKHWTVAHKGDASLFALDLHAGRPGFAVGQSGTILRTTDDGATWSELESHSTANLLGVSADPNGQVIVTAMDTVLRSGDGGSTWNPADWGDFGSAWYAGVQFLGSQPATAILVGHAGRILRMNF